MFVLHEKTVPFTPAHAQTQNYKPYIDHCLNGGLTIVIITVTSAHAQNVPPEKDHYRYLNE
jgi:hypothetical protein